MNSNNVNTQCSQYELGTTITYAIQCQ